jgi:uncharacterized protein DUF3592
MEIMSRLQGFNSTAVMTVVGLLMIAYGVGRLCLQLLNRQYIRETTGQLVGWQEKNDALVSFRAEDGTEHQITTTVLATAKSGMRVGDPFPVPVVYDTRHPGRAVIGRTRFFWIAHLLWVALGAGAIFLATDDFSGMIDRVQSRLTRLDMIDAMRTAGAVFAAVGIAGLYRRTFLVRGWPTTIGKLVAWKEKKSFGAGRSGRSLTTYYYAVVSFTAVDGSPYQVISESGSSKQSAPMGHPFPVKYNPRNPSDAFIATPWGLWGLSVVCLVIGVGLLALTW